MTQCLILYLQVNRYFCQTEMMICREHYKLRTTLQTLILNEKLSTKIEISAFKEQVPVQSKFVKGNTVLKQVNIQDVKFHTKRKRI
jgi:hypothetical protein